MVGNPILSPLYTRDQLDKVEFYMYYGDMHVPYDVMEMPLRRIGKFMSLYEEQKRKEKEQAESKK